MKKVKPPRRELRFPECHIILTAASSRWSVVFHQRLYNIEELQQRSKGFDHLRCSVLIRIRDPPRLVAFQRRSNFSSMESRALRTLHLVFSYFLFPLFRVPLRLRFPEFSPPFSFGVPSIFCFGKCRARVHIFYDPWVQYENSSEYLKFVYRSNVVHSYCCGLPNGQPLY